MLIPFCTNPSMVNLGMISTWAAVSSPAVQLLVQGWVISTTPVDVDFTIQFLSKKSLGIRVFFTHLKHQLIGVFMYLLCSTIVTMWAPKIAKLVYNSNNYGLWYLQLQLWGFINQLTSLGVLTQLKYVYPRRRFFVETTNIRLRPRSFDLAQSSLMGQITSPISQMINVKYPLIIVSDIGDDFIFISFFNTKMNDLGVPPFQKTPYMMIFNG